MINFSRGKMLLSAAFLTAAFASGCGNSDSFVFTNTRVTQPPVAVADAFNALGNATLNRAAPGVLANDTPNGGQISSFDAVGSQGGAIVLNADGSFSYTPVAGFVGAETFTYTLSNSDGASSATVTLTSSALGRFVDNTAPAGGTGTQAAPFNLLADAVAAAQNGDTIFVSRGDGTSTGLAGAFNLPSGVSLIGEGTGLILPQVIVPAGQAPVLTGPVTCLGDNTISGIGFDGSAASTVVVNGVGGVTVENNTFAGSALDHIDVDNFAGTVTIDRNTFTEAPMNGQNYIDVRNDGTDGTIVVTQNVFQNTNSDPVNALCNLVTQGAADVAVTFSNNSALGTVAEQFSRGFAFQNTGTGDCSAVCVGNMLSNLSNRGILLFGGDITGTISDNVFDNIDQSNAAIQCELFSNSVSITGNTMTDADFGALIGFQGTGARVLLENNNMTGSGIAIQASAFSADSSGSLLVRNNTLLDSTAASLGVSVSGANNAVICCDVTGNTVNDDMIFEHSVLGASALNVERFLAPEGGPLNAVNTFNAGTVMTTGTVTSRTAGFCSP